MCGIKAGGGFGPGLAFAGAGIRPGCAEKQMLKMVAGAMMETLEGGLMGALGCGGGPFAGMGGCACPCMRPNFGGGAAAAAGAGGAMAEAGFGGAAAFSGAGAAAGGFRMAMGGFLGGGTAAFASFGFAAAGAL